MEDETGILKKPIETTGTVVSETITKTSGPIPFEESTLNGISVRGWIALISVVAISIALILLLIAVMLGKMNSIDATSVSIITMIAGLLANIAATYIGQGQKPKSK